MSQKVSYDSVTIDAATRTAITAIVDCDDVTLSNLDTTNDCTLYDAATGGGSRTLAAGDSRAYRRRSSVGGHWRVGDTIIWATAAAGPGPIQVEYLL